MNLVGGGKASGSEGENSENEPMVLDADNENMAQARHVEPVSCDYISRRDGNQTSSAATHGGRSTDAGGPATAPLISKDAIGEPAADGTVRIPCPAPQRVGGASNKDGQ